MRQVLSVFGLVKEGHSHEEAASTIATINRRFTSDHAGVYRVASSGFQATAIDVRTALTQGARDLLLILPTAEEKDAAKARIDVLKSRRNDLRKTYVAARFDELKADVRAEGNRVAAWTRRTFNRDEASNAQRSIDNAVTDA